MNGTNAAKRAMFGAAARGTVSTGQILAAILVPFLAGAGIYISMMVADLDPARVAATWLPALAAGWLDAVPYPSVPAVARHIVAAGLGLGIIALFAAWQRYRIDPTADRHLSGRQLVTVPRRTKKVQEQLCRIEGRGIPLAVADDGTEIPMSRAQETRHIFVCGGVGSGKTNAIRPLIDAARRRGDKLIIYDNKSDFFPGLDGGESPEDIALLAPWDRRGWRWDVARDIRTRGDALALAEALIPRMEGGNSFFSDAARAVCVALIRRLQHERPNEWRFADLATIVARGFEEVRHTVAKHYPEAILIVDGAAGADAQEGEESKGANKTTQSVLATLVTGLVQVFQLIDSWDRCAVPGAISIRDWLSDDYTGPRTIILGGNKSMEALERSVAQSILGVVQRVISSPEMPDSDTRRIWLFLDEFPQLSRLDGFGRFLEIGRSKGVRAVLGFQSVPQLEKVYSREELQTWSSLVGTWLIGRTGGSESPRWLSDLIGEREVLRWLPSYSRSRVRAAGAPVPSQSDQYQQLRVPVVSPDELSCLRPGEFFYLPLGSDEVHRFRFRALTAEEKAPKRKHYLPARWTQPDWPTSEEQQQIAAAAGLLPGGAEIKKAEKKEKEREAEEEEQKHQDERLVTETTPARHAHTPVAAEAGEDVVGEAISRAEVEQVAHALDQVLPGFGALLESLHLASEITDAPLQTEQTATIRTRPQQLEEPGRKKRRKKRKHEHNREEEQEL